MIDPAATAGEVVERTLGSGAPQVFVVGPDGTLKGIVSASAALRADRQQGISALIAEPAVIVSPEEKLETAFKTLARLGGGSLPVVEEGRLVGALNGRAIEALWRARRMEQTPSALRHREA